MMNQYCLYCMEKLSPNGSSCAKCKRRQDYTAPLHHMMPGSILRERYLIGSALGEGGFGITYIGRDLMLDMRIAVKEFYPNGYSHRNNTVSNTVARTDSGSTQEYEKDMRRFLNEARTLAKFSDEPGIVGVRDFFRENGTAYIVMEFLDGITLKEYLNRKGTLDPASVFAMLDPVMRSLHQIHGQNLVHRDISPDNIMILRSGQVKLLDFGAARDTTGEKSLSVVLKHGYAPVEQYQSRGNQGGWTDEYALCATMYKCITGVTPLESLERIYQDDLLPPSRLGIPMHPVQEAALMKGLEVRPENRFPSMEALRQALLSPERYPQEYSSTVLQEPVERSVRRSQIRQDIGVTQPMNTVHSVHPTTGAPVMQDIGQTQPMNTGYSVHPITGAPVAQDIGVTQPMDSGANAPTVQQPPIQKLPHQPKKKSGKKRTGGKKGLLLALAGFACAGALAVFLGGLSSKAPKAVGAAGTSRSYGYTLTQVGTIQDREMALDYDTGRNVLIQEGENGDLLLTPMGEAVSGILLEQAQYLGSGTYLIRQAGGGPNSAGLVNDRGQMLIPCEACVIQWADRSSYAGAKQRYLLVAYAQEQTQDEDSCFLKFGSGSYSLGNTLWDDYIGYTGYGRIFDMETGRFVENIVLDRENVSSIRICGDNITLRGEDGVTVYTPDGRELLRMSAGGSVGGEILVDYTSGTSRIMDANGTELYATNNPVSLISGSGGYLYRSQEGVTTVLDRYGNLVLELGDAYINSEHNGIFLIRDRRSEKYGLIRQDGTWIVEPDYFDYLSYEKYGFFYGYSEKHKDVDRKYSLIGDQGILAADLPYVGSFVMMEDTKAFVVADADYTLDVQETFPRKLMDGMVAVRQGTDKIYSVYDLFTGEQLLPASYTTVFAAGEYIYAYKNGAWEVYQVTGPEK